jgi:hypothetical protein
MSEATDNLVLEILKHIQAQMADHGARLDRIEDLIRKQRRDTAGLLVMAKSVTGDLAK